MNSITTASFNESSQKNTNPNKSIKPWIDNKQNQTKKRRRKHRKRKRNKNKASSQKKASSIESKPNQFAQSNITENMVQQTTSKQTDEIIITTKNGKLAAPKIIDSAHNYMVMEEPPKIYEDVTLPFIMKYKDDKSSEWIHKCSNHTKEDEKHLKLSGDEYFIAYIRSNWIKENKHCDPLKYPDPNEWGKHKQTDPQHLRIMAIVNTKKYNKLITLRDIRGDVHYDLLNHIKMTLCQQIERIYGVNRDKLKIYLHYRPTALLLHIHFVHENNYNQHSQKYRDHFIDDILKNIKCKSDYYKHETLPHQIYFDRKKSIIFAQHTKDLMNMQGIHPWYDTKTLSQITKRLINKNMAIREDNDNEWNNDSKTNEWINDKNPLSQTTKRPINKSMAIKEDNDKLSNHTQCKTDDIHRKFKVNKSKPAVDTDKTNNRFPTNNDMNNYGNNNYRRNNYQSNKNQYDDDSKWSKIR